MNATSAGPTVSPISVPWDGRPSAMVVRAPVAGSTEEMRPVKPFITVAPSSVTNSVSPPVPASAT